MIVTLYQETFTLTIWGIDIRISLFLPTSLPDLITSLYGNYEFYKENLLKEGIKSEKLFKIIYRGITSTVISAIKITKINQQGRKTFSYILYLIDLSPSLSSICVPPIIYWLQRLTMHVLQSLPHLSSHP